MMMMMMMMNDDPKARPWLLRNKRTRVNVSLLLGAVRRCWISQSAGEVSWQHAVARFRRNQLHGQRPPRRSRLSVVIHRVTALLNDRLHHRRSVSGASTPTFCRIACVRLCDVRDKTKCEAGRIAIGQSINIRLIMAWQNAGQIQRMNNMQIYKQAYNVSKHSLREERVRLELCSHSICFI